MSCEPIAKALVGQRLIASARGEVKFRHLEARAETEDDFFGRFVGYITDRSTLS
jgi:hypothetical protein